MVRCVVTVLPVPTLCYLCTPTARAALQVPRALLPAAMELNFLLRLLLRRNRVLKYSPGEFLPPGCIIPMAEVLRAAGMFSAGI